MRTLREPSGPCVPALLACVLAVAWALAFACAGPAWANEAQGASGGQERVLSVAEQVVRVQVCLDGIEDLPGTAVAVSVGGQGRELYAGAADVAGTDPVDGQTAFEWGRCADLIVWASVMQLVEEGLLNLSDEVVGLVPAGVVLPEGYERLDVIDLMNHTSGLDVSLVGTYDTLPDGTSSVLPAFALFSVAAEFDPGEVVGYTPYDALLGAAVVEGVAQVPFADYVREHVLKPLGMEGTYVMVGGSPARMAAQSGSPLQALALARGRTTQGAAGTSQAVASSVVTCFGPVGDLVRLANGLMGTDGWPSLFLEPQTSETFFEATRAYPSLDVARFAHGMFAFPFAQGVFGMWASTAGGFSAALLMDRAEGLAVAVLANEAGRFDVVQGVPRALVGSSDAVVAGVGSPASDVWTGVYQNAASASHGPAKFLTTLGRTAVTLGDDGELLLDGIGTRMLGAGVYVVDDAADQDVYRFHVSLRRGEEYSRVASDSYVVPWSTMAVEAGLLVSGAVGMAVCLCYAVAGLAAGLRARMRRRRVRLQPAVLCMAGFAAASGILAVVALVRVASGWAPAALEALLVAAGACVAIVLASAAWLAFTRRATTAWTRRQNAVALAVALAALAVVLNLAYWEMLP